MPSQMRIATKGLASVLEELPGLCVVPLRSRVCSRVGLCRRARANALAKFSRRRQIADEQA